MFSIIISIQFIGYKHKFENNKNAYAPSQVSVQQSSSERIFRCLSDYSGEESLESLQSVVNRPAVKVP